MLKILWLCFCGHSAVTMKYYLGLCALVQGVVSNDLE